MGPCIAVAVVAIILFIPSASASDPDARCESTFHGFVEDASGNGILGAVVQGPGGAEWSTDFFGRYEGRDSFPCDVERVVLASYFSHPTMTEGVARETKLVPIAAGTDGYMVTFQLPIDAADVTGFTAFMGPRFVQGFWDAVATVLVGFVLTGGFRLRWPDAEPGTPDAEPGRARFTMERL